MFRIVITSAILLLLGATALHAQRIGYAEPQAILDALPERNAIERELEEFYEQWEDDYNVAYEIYSEELFLFEQNRGNMSQNERQRAQQNLQQLAMQLQELQQEFSIRFDERRAELTAPVVESIYQAIQTVAKDLNLDYVLNKETSLSDPIVFITQNNPNAINITDRVIQLLTQ